MSGVRNYPEHDVTARNDKGESYTSGNADTNGSLRQIPDTEFPVDRIEFQKRKNGAWNHTTIDVAGTDAMAMGDGVVIGAAGSHLKTTATGSDKTYLYAHTQYNNASGSAEAGQSPIFSAQTVRSILQPDNSGELSGTVITWTETISVTRMISRIYLDVTSAATDNVALSITATGLSSGIEFDLNIGASELALGEQFIDLDGWVEETERDVVVTFTLTVDNGGTLAIAADVNDLVAWYAYDYYTITHGISAPLDVTIDSIIFDRDTFQNVLTTDGNGIMTRPATEV
jgi:hypothetical protein